MMWAKKRRCLMEKEEPFDDDDNHQIKDLINTLSLDSLAQIFMLLPVYERIDMEKVCSKWKDASELAWYDIKKYKCGVSTGHAYNNQKLTQEYVEKILLRCGKYLNELSIPIFCDSSIMPLVVKHCKNLTRLEFEYNEESKIDTNHFVDAFKQLQQLKYIKIIEDESEYYKIRRISFDIVDFLPDEINEIHLLFKKRYDSTRLFVFNLQKFKNLHSLTLKECNLDNIIQEISEKKTLVYLDLRDCVMTQEIVMFDKLVNLENLSINTFNYKLGRYKITTILVNSILNTCENLRYLSIPCSVFGLTDISFKNSVNFENLIHLEIAFSINDNSAMKILQTCKNIQHLHLLANVQPTALRIIVKLENLQSLILARNQYICNETLIQISYFCYKLKRLEMPGFCTARPVNSQNLSPIFSFDDLAKLEYLKHLNLSNVSELKDSNIIVIANQCKNLEFLSINRCKGITETGLIALMSLKKLVDLSFQENPNVTDKSISTFKGLKKMWCDDCKNLTDVGVIEFIKNCPNLEHLNVTRISNLTVKTIIGANEAKINIVNDVILKLFISININNIRNLKNKSPQLIVNGI